MRKSDPVIWKEYLECQCSTKEHLAVLEYDEEIGMMLSLQAFRWQSFFKRCWTAIKYVFGSGQITWDTCMVKSEDLAKIKKWVARV